MANYTYFASDKSRVDSKILTKYIFSCVDCGRCFFFSFAKIYFCALKCQVGHILNEGFLRSFLEPELECKSDFYAKELIFRGKKGAKLNTNMVFKILYATHFLPNFV